MSSGRIIWARMMLHGSQKVKFTVQRLATRCTDPLLVRDLVVGLAPFPFRTLMEDPTFRHLFITSICILFSSRCLHYLWRSSWRRYHCSTSDMSGWQSTRWFACTCPCNRLWIFHNHHSSCPLMPSKTWPLMSSWSTWPLMTPPSGIHFSTTSQVTGCIGLQTQQHKNSCAMRCHTPNTFGTVNMEHTINSSLSWSEQWVRPT